ncbi:hypothetical protein GYA27_03790 [candidate division WWE3 bacterium]|uniref:CBU-0592-like domain-containing protein n=1 Tax=candidate division WWE3 bacterium TaxID=2053526 RepID=A0A7X9DKR4_UNCKA|nr:hypothetical protein [candidate division WWE3 bacterium]
MSSKFANIVGWYGSAAVLTAYTLVSFSIITAHTRIYQVLNVTGALGIIVVSLSKKAYQPAVLNIVWALIGLVAIIKLLI